MRKRRKREREREKEEEEKGFFSFSRHRRSQRGAHEHNHGNRTHTRAPRVTGIDTEVGIQSSGEFFGALSRWLVGQRLDTKSKPCPEFVQSLSRLCPTESKVQVLSNPCPTMCHHVQSLSSGCPHTVQSKAIGQTLDIKSPEFVQSLSNEIQYVGQILDLDNLWTQLRFYVSDNIF